MFRLKGNRFRKKAVQQKIRNFLLSDNSREFLIFLFFFIVSGGFWLLQTLKDEYEAELTFPLKIKDVPGNVILTSELPQELRVRVRDKGTTLISYIMTRQFYPITVDFAAYRSQGYHVRILGKDLEKRIKSQLDASTALLGMRPDTLEYIYSHGKAKKIPVRLVGKVSTTPLYYFTDTIYNPDSIVVYAPEFIGDSLTIAETERVEFENQTDTLKMRLALRPIKGVKYVPDQVDVTMPVDIITEKTIEVPLVGVGFPSDKVLRTFPSKVKLTFQVGLNSFRKIHANQFVVEIPYSELLENEDGKYKVRIASKPSEVSHVRISPAEVEFLIEEKHEYDD